MRAIIISDTDAMALLDKLQLKNLQGCGHVRENPTMPPTMSDMHRTFHYVVTRWLQEQGCDCVG